MTKNWLHHLCNVAQYLWCCRTSAAGRTEMFADTWSALPLTLTECTVRWTVCGSGLAASLAMAMLSHKSYCRQHWYIL